MTDAEAIALLKACDEWPFYGDWPEDGSLPFGFSEGNYKDRVCLDGYYTLDELRAVIHLLSR
jgi:hypothetical protein